MGDIQEVEMNGLVIGTLVDQHIDELRREAARRRLARKAEAVDRRHKARRTR
jgi:hypothetical protein